MTVRTRSLLAGASLALVIAVANPSPADVILPSSAFSSGANGALFRSNVRVLNTGAEPASVVPVLYDQATGETVARPAVTIPPRQQVRWDNVLSTLFGRNAPSFGPIRLQTSSSSLVVSSSVDNVNACGSGAVSGQWLPGIDAAQALSAGVLAQLAASADPQSGYRTNVVFFNPGAETATVSAKVRRGDGTLLSAVTLAPLGPNGFLQRRLDDAGTFPGVSGTTDTNLWLEFTADRPVLSFASVIHNVSGDPFAIVAVRDTPPPASQDPTTEQLKAYVATFPPMPRQTSTFCASSTLLASSPSPRAPPTTTWSTPSSTRATSRARRRVSTSSAPSTPRTRSREPEGSASSVA